MEKGIDLLSAEQPSVYVPDGSIVLNLETIGKLSEQYVLIWVPGKAIDFVYIEKCLQNNQNDRVIFYIDDLSMDSGILTGNQSVKLMKYKGIAYFQKEGNVDKVFSIFDRLQQVMRDDPYFCRYMGMILNKGGHKLESALYFGRAADVMGDVFLPEADSPWKEKERYAYSLIKNLKTRHFIFIRPYPWRNVRGYYESLAIMLRNIGNKVTFFNLTENTFIRMSATRDNRHKAAKRMLDSRTKADCIYDYGIECYELI